MEIHENSDRKEDIFMIRCIASDMDGTLLNSNQEISQLNREAISYAKQQGIEVVIATGRSYEEAHYILEESGIKCPIIAVNGAEIRNEHGEITQTAGIDGEVAKEIGKALNQIGIYFEIYTNKGKFTEDYERSISVIVDIYKTANPEKDINEIRSTVEEHFAGGFIQSIQDYGVIFSDPEYIIYKIIVFSKDHELLEKASESLKRIEKIKVTSSAQDNLEINDIHAQKGIALEAFVKEKGITLEETMAMGDNFNDLSMLQKVGHPVAMGNAEQEIKNIILNHTTSNNEDGVGRAIYQALNVLK